MSAPSRGTQRILGCLDLLSEEETRAFARRDWAHLNCVIEREHALISQLAKQSDRTTSEVLERAQALGQRLSKLHGQIEGQRQHMGHELKQLGAARQRSKAVRAVYFQG